MYYNGLKSNYKSIRAPLGCNIAEEERKLKESVTDMIKITDTFNILKKDLTDDIIKKFRWCQPLIEYPEQPLPIDPYILGLWLSDGHSNIISLTSIDTVLIDYWVDFAILNGLDVKRTNPKPRKNKAKDFEMDTTISYNINSGRKIHNNPVLKEFQKLNLINNKHIPEIYLNNSIENRLKVLAGIIDTDGYLDRCRYEIVQKSTVLSENIIRLANSLGFFITNHIKKACATNTESKIVRDYNRMYIFVSQINLEIPVLLERKKFKSTEKRFFHNPKILINGNHLTERITWSENLDTLLVESVKNYRSIKGKNLIPWTLIIKEVPEFNTFSPDALRIRYRNI
jgi:hypothetical protein